MRETIEKIIYEKNKHAINISPDFITNCLQSTYCSTNGCFAFNTSEKSDTNSIMFDELYKILNTPTSNRYTKIQELYKEIIISAFCVLNISRKANNPPPVPYMDINELKRVFFADISTKEQFANFIEQGKRIVGMITNTCGTYDTRESFNDKVSDLIVTPQIYDISIITSPLVHDKKTIFGDFEEIINSPYNKFIQNYKKILMYKERIRRFINMVDNSNAISAIGTLESIERMSKYYTVDTLCKAEAFDNKYKSLYRENPTNGGKHTRKRKQKNIPRII